MNEWMNIGAVGSGIELWPPAWEHKHANSRPRICDDKYGNSEHFKNVFVIFI